MTLDRLDPSLLPPSLIMLLSTDSGKQYHLHCTGEALDTANAHAGDADITLFGSCFCPFVQRVWVAFEHLGIPYRVRPVTVSFPST